MIMGYNTHKNEYLSMIFRDESHKSEYLSEILPIKVSI